ncbi:hypothetical protein Tco_0706131 [Tanacetum coccineum]|uniref:Uncharacterized protein n=1 Tax=Tanacetum coccineum TaxID=301880 RepID=A0ABQ4Y6N3_9ASTR
MTGFGLEETRFTRRVNHPVDGVGMHSVGLQDSNQECWHNGYGLGATDVESGRGNLEGNDLWSNYRLRRNGDVCYRRNGNKWKRLEKGHGTPASKILRISFLMSCGKLALTIV